MKFDGNKFYQITIKESLIYTNNYDVVALDDIIIKDRVCGMFMCSTLLDGFFISDFLPSERRVPIIVVLDEQSNKHYREMKNVTFIQPPIPKHGLLFPSAYRPIFHSKMMIIIYEE